jgi:hypothetical protein
VPVFFDFNAWIPIRNVENNVRTYVLGNTAPLRGSDSAAITLGWREKGKGSIFFTSYHIEGASTGSNQERVLKYLLLNFGELTF